MGLEVVVCRRVTKDREKYKNRVKGKLTTFSLSKLKTAYGVLCHVKQGSCERNSEHIAGCSYILRPYRTLGLQLE